jgi:hypothetical protein
MAQNKDDKKKDVKVQDLAPKKDAKGGGRYNVTAASQAGVNRSSTSASSENSSLNATNKTLD